MIQLLQDIIAESPISPLPTASKGHLLATNSSSAPSTSYPSSHHHPTLAILLNHHHLLRAILLNHHHLLRAILLNHHHLLRAILLNHHHLLRAILLNHHHLLRAIHHQVTSDSLATVIPLATLIHHQATIAFRVRHLIIVHQS